MATMVMAITVAPATAMRDVTLLRRGDATVVCEARKQGYALSITLAAAHPLNSSPALGLRTGRIEPRWPVKKAGGSGARSAVANAPVFPDPLGLAGSLSWP